MRKVILLLILVCGAIHLVPGKLSPLTVKDITLMLRSGYSVPVVEEDLAKRHFMEAIDSAAERTLAEAGAGRALIDALKNGLYAVPADEVAAVQQEAEAKARRQVAQQEEAKKWNTLYQDQLARSRTVAATLAAPSTSALAPLVRGDLVTSKNGILSAFNDQPFEKKKLIALYFSARWCPSCRKFTPQLVEYYNRVAASHPEFEIVFISNDRSSSAMEAYMRDMQMPWPAIAYDKVAEKEGLNRYAGGGIPCLVLVDAQGRVISDSYDGKKYLGPEKVLADLEQIFANGAKPAVAQTR